MKLQSQDAEVFASYPRAIAHMWHQLHSNRLGLILGSGVSKPLGYPDWQELIDRIAGDGSIRGRSLIKTQRGKALPLQAQILFERFCERSQRRLDLRGVPESEANRILRAAWRNLVHKCLYRGIPKTEAALTNTVYGHFAEVVKKTPMTVNYNFDDTLERLLLELRSPEEEQRTRGFETVVDARLQFKLNSAIIYHPNGFLPKNLLDGPSDDVVLTEGALGDQLIESMGGHYSALINHLSKNTCLLLGLSLEDQTLRHLLRQHARMNPGHVHYYVRFVKSHRPSADVCQAEADANFAVFNLVTLFLDQRGLASLGKLLSAQKRDVRDVADQVHKRTSYCFYLTGVPGTGKTTTTSYFRNLITYDEWLEERPADLGKPHTVLAREQRKAVDDWIMEQIHVKNNALTEDAQSDPIGIRFVDRCLIDAVVFSKSGRWPQKASAIKATIAKGKSRQVVHGGKVILLLGDPKEMAIRVKSRNKRTTPKYTDELQQAMKSLYRSGQGVNHLDVVGDTVNEVVKKVARIVHLDDYQECNLQNVLNRVEAGTLAPPKQKRDTRLLSLSPKRGTATHSARGRVASHVSPRRGRHR